MEYDYQNTFAKILRKEISCIEVYEDNLTLAFMDIMPENLGHILVIPKEYSVDFLSLSSLGAISVLKTAKKVAVAQKKALNCDGILIKQMNGKIVGQTIFHYHMHLIPGYVNQTLEKRNFYQMKKNELEAIAKKIQCEI